MGRNFQNEPGALLARRPVGPLDPRLPSQHLHHPGDDREPDAGPVVPDTDDPTPDADDPTPDADDPGPSWPNVVINEVAANFFAHLTIFFRYFATMLNLQSCTSLLESLERSISAVTSIHSIVVVKRTRCSKPR